MDTTSIPAMDQRTSRGDRLGVYASVLCGIHCALTPFLLILAPAFGGIWSSPMAHWIAAAFVVPLAVFMIRKGYRQHHKRWIAAVGTIGIALTLTGAALPYASKGSANTQAELTQAEATQVETTHAETTQAETTQAHTTEADTVNASEGTACTDSCCPTITATEEGKLSLHVPPASATTILGGFFLIITHVSNIRAGCGCGKSSCKQ